MKKAISLVLASALLGGVAIAAQGTGGQPGANPMGNMGNMMQGMQAMQNMDSNGDGKVSKDEFMKSHEAMFDAMKNKDGVVTMADMSMCPMMKGMPEQKGR